MSNMSDKNPTPPSNGWYEYQRLVLDTLERHEAALTKLNDKLDAIRIKDIPHISADITALKVKSGMWGAVAGTVFSAFVAAITKLFFGTPS